MRTTKKQQVSNRETTNPEQNFVRPGTHIIIMLGNCMEPTLRDSDKVLAEIVNRANWPEIVGPVAVLVYSKITVGRVVKNDLTDHSTITLIPDNELCQSSTFNDLDIIDMWSIIEIISAKVL